MSDERPDYLNSNGLKSGLIPEGSACPFLEECGFKVDRCPTEEKPVPPTAYHEVYNMVGYSCGAARFHSMSLIILKLKAEKRK